MTDAVQAAIGADPSLLLLDDDQSFVKRLARAMEKRGFVPVIAETIAQGKGVVAIRASNSANQPTNQPRCQEN